MWSQIIHRYNLPKADHELIKFNDLALIIIFVHTVMHSLSGYD